MHSHRQSRVRRGFYFCCVSAAVVAPALNRNRGQTHLICTGLTRAVETHEFLKELRAQAVHLFSITWTEVRNRSKRYIWTLVCDVLQSLWKMNTKLN